MAHQAMPLIKGMKENSNNFWMIDLSVEKPIWNFG
jgi:hypothetical protein